MTKHTVTVPAFDIEIEGPDRRGLWRIPGWGTRSTREVRDIARLGATDHDRALFTSILAHIESLPAPDPEPNTVEEFDDHRAVFWPRNEDDSHPWLVERWNCERGRYTRDDYATLKAEASRG